jgi:putative membrane protein
MRTAGIVMMMIILISCKEKVIEPIDSEKYSSRETIRDYKKDADFLTDAIEFNLEEIRLAKLAQQNSINPETRNIADNLEKAHTLLDDELRKIADKKEFFVPDTVKQDTKEKKLSYEIGEDFDIKYFKRITIDYQYAVERFEYASHNCKDKELVLWTKKAIPVLRKNLGIVIVQQAESQKKKRK